MRLIVSFILVAVFALSLAACNTFNGLGQDMSSAGHAISKAAK